MKTFPLIVSLFIFLSLGAGFTVINTHGENETLGIGKPACFQGGCRYNVQGWIFVHIEGEPYERGYQYGYLLSAEIVDMISRWSHIIHNAPLIGPLTGNLGTSRYDAISQRWWSTCKSQIYRMYWNDYPLEYQDEIRGIADGVSDRGGQVFDEAITSEDILAINEMYEFITKIGNRPKSLHFLRTLFNNIKQLIPSLTKDDEISFITSFINQSQAHHCTGFIATGGATTDGQIVATQATWFGSSSWWFNAYIAERWNVILDIQPSQGNRLLFTTAPGYIWSDENYYHNEKGIVMMDTTAPQGLWARRGLPLAVRSRTAAQYGENIDDVIAYLLEGNDGVWTAVWLIGDTKTGEIARMDLGLYNYGIWRSYDGFYWSANNIMDAKVRAERRLGTLKGRALQLLGIVYPTTGWYEYYTREYHPNPRDILFEELGQEHYGDIDSEWMKKIMASSPFTDFSSDTKVSDSFLIAQNGLWVHYGNPGGIIWNTTHLDEILPGGTNLPPLGWVRIYGLPDEYDHVPNYQVSDDSLDSTSIVWEQQIIDDNPKNTRFTYNTVSGTTLYAVTSTGVVHAFDASTGQRKWVQDLNGVPVGPPVCGNSILAVGLQNGFYILNKATGNIDWYKSLYCTSQPIIINQDVIVGCYNQVLSFTAQTGSENWQINTPGETYLSNPWKNRIFIGTGNSCWALNCEDGELEWKFETRGPVTTSPAVCSQGYVYLGSWDTNLYALDAASGTQKWMFPMGWGIGATPSIKDETVFFGSMDNNFYAIDASRGNLIWSYVCQGSIQTTPLIYGDNVFFACDDGHLYSLNQTTGRLVWRFSPGYNLKEDVYTYLTTPLLSSPVFHNGTIYLGTRGTLFALDAQTWEKEDEDGGDDILDILTISDISPFMIAVIIIIGCLVLIPSIYTYRKNKKGA